MASLGVADAATPAAAVAALVSRILAADARSRAVVFARAVGGDAVAGAGGGRDAGLPLAAAGCGGGRAVDGAGAAAAACGVTE